MKNLKAPSSKKGFTLIEMIATLAIISILATAVYPLAKVTATKNREIELKQSLRKIREALDGYKRAWDEGRIERKVGESGYPPNLEILVTGVTDRASPGGKKIYFLRRIPRDPFNDDNTLPPEKTWGLRSYDSDYNNPKEGNDVFDVFSKSQKTALDGSRYSEW